MIHAYASLVHYADHIAPILAALPPELRGWMHSPGAGKPWGLPLVSGLRPPANPDDVWIVAGYADAQRMKGRRLAYVEHGAGQTYPGDPRSAQHGAFSGGDGLGHVGLFLAPHDTVAARWRARYPQAAVEVVGCPKLDRWHRGCDIRPKALTGDVTPGSVVAMTFHHSNAQIPEQQPAWTHYRDAVPALRDALAASGGVLLGHGHPRAARTYAAFWERLGVEWVPDLGDVFDRADVLVADNTSAAYEAASIGLPIVWLSAPWYRRDVNHGGRFWSDVDGLPHAEDPADLWPMIQRAIADPREDQAARRRIVTCHYAYTDGQASERAAVAVLRFAAQA